MLAAARVVVLHGAEAPKAFAGLVVDITAEFVSQIGFIAVGLMLGWSVLRANPVMTPYVDAVIFGTALLIPGAALFVVLQHKGSVLVERIAGHALPVAVRHTEAFTKALHGLYRNPARLAAATLLHFVNWIVSGVWLWLTIRLTGAPITITDAIVMHSLLEALRSAAVIVPSSIGVQEAGLAMLAPVFGLGPEIGLAASLLRRARDIVIGVPVLLAWQVVEGRRAIKQAV
jgi:putative membrane protein